MLPSIANSLLSAIAVCIIIPQLTGKAEIEWEDLFGVESAILKMGHLSRPFNRLFVIIIRIGKGWATFPSADNTGMDREGEVLYVDPDGARQEIFRCGATGKGCEFSPGVAEPELFVVVDGSIALTDDPERGELWSGRVGQRSPGWGVDGEPGGYLVYTAGDPF
jgi:hypothetical protein